MTASSTASFTLGILETGRVPDPLSGKYEPYPAMFRELLAETGATFRTYAILDGDIPSDPSECDAWLITGSKFGVYDGFDWIEKLKEFVRKAHEARRPIVGICFGHQLIAEALGGKVEKSDKGWGVGLHSWHLTGKADWMEGAGEDFALQVSHQDQVVKLPEGAKVLASSDFCPNALLAYDDWAVSFQGHPEFSAGFSEDLIRMRRGTVLPEDFADKALAHVHDREDSGKVAHWITVFLKKALAAKKASEAERA
ncbi:gamma-glutamyl-gamma-aminobutyrate hydrolase family protein [Stappia sp. F7233]|uniref:Gamma-glutamyl-gamma-aminobutyrate hydrolase family protein n=1 Tax=Stappia albiluteola TaxID=2758565 RepID=A0A839AIL1_9HYPH|nr:gamma-glutamyl-gamma-aminobutyrate hydrolase family protein [Stappia albiluteola]MBA5778762.1 gamma-glutamyl-gamma-aminobutyrate hydrolase family protein [Stappia albiluteola]